MRLMCNATASNWTMRLMCNATASNSAVWQFASPHDCLEPKYGRFEVSYYSDLMLKVMKNTIKTHCDDWEPSNMGCTCMHWQSVQKNALIRDCSDTVMGASASWNLRGLAPLCTWGWSQPHILLSDMLPSDVVLDANVLSDNWSPMNTTASKPLGGVVVSAFWIIKWCLFLSSKYV